MPENRKKEEFEPDAYLDDSTPEEAIHHDEKEKDFTAIEHEHYSQPNKESNKEHYEDDEFEIKDAYKTPDDIQGEREGNKWKIIIIVLIFGIFILIMSWFFKAVKEVNKEQVRAEARSLNTPQDMNMTGDSITWQTAKDGEIKNLQNQLAQLNAKIASGNIDANTTATTSNNPFAKNKPQEQALTKTDIEAIIAKELSKNKTPYKNSTAFPVVKMPKNLRNVIKNIQKKDGTLSVDDFLVADDNGHKDAPSTVNNALIPPKTTNKTNTVDIPQITTNNSNQSFARRKNMPVITDMGTLKTNYMGSDINGSKKQRKSYFLTQGLAKATLYTGFLAPTLVAGNKNPQPVYLSVDTPVLSANDSTIDLQECTVLGSAKGSLSTSRVEIRLSELNCNLTYKNGKKTHITQAINGWVYGEDGVFGLKGRLVSSEGKIIKSALPMALIQALIGSLSQLGQQPMSVATLGATSMVNPQSLQSGALQGVAKSTNQSLSQIIDYYMAMLKELNPSIEILGGRNNLSILFKGGEELKEKDYTAIDQAQITKENR